MAIKHKNLRVYKDTYDILIDRKLNMERIVREATGKKVRIPVTRVAHLSIKPKIQLDNKTIGDLSRRKRKRW